MDRISALGYVLNPAGHRVFVNENLATGVNGTDVDQVWLTGIQEELAAVIENAGLALNAADTTQLLQALGKSLFQASYQYFNAAQITLPVGWYRYRLGGAGGGGGGCTGAYEGAGGGGSGNELAGSFLVQQAGVFPFVPGGGGLGGGQGANAGSSLATVGGNSTFLNLVATGGGAGQGATGAGSPGGGGLYIAGSGQQSGVPAGIAELSAMLQAGSDGSDGTGLQGVPSRFALAGNGAPGSLGGGGRGGNPSGATAYSPGGGGGGCYTLVDPPQGGVLPGGDGGAGYLFLDTLALVSPAGA